MPLSREVYEQAMERAGFCCQRCGSRTNLEAHHIMPKTKANIKKYPHFIHSLSNIVILCGSLSNACHVNKKHFYKITDKQAEEYEYTLREECEQ